MAPRTRRHARPKHDDPTAHTPDRPEPGTAGGGLGQDARVDGSLILADFPSELLVILAETIGNPLGLLVSKAHLSTSFHEAACAALAILESVDLSKWSRTVDDAAVAAVASKCPQLSSLYLSFCGRITDAAVVAVASGCKQLVSLILDRCENITDVAVVAVAFGCKRLTSLGLDSCHGITDLGVKALALERKQLESLDLSFCKKITDAAVVAVASECKQLTTLNLADCENITDLAVLAMALRDARSSSCST